MTERISAVALLSPNKSIKNTLHSSNIDNKTNDSEGSHTPEDLTKSVLSLQFAQVFCAILLLLVCNVLK